MCFTERSRRAQSLSDTRPFSAEVYLHHVAWRARPRLRRPHLASAWVPVPAACSHSLWRRQRPRRSPALSFPALGSSTGPTSVTQSVWGVNQQMQTHFLIQFSKFIYLPLFKKQKFCVGSLPKCHHLSELGQNKAVSV